MIRTLRNQTQSIFFRIFLGFLIIGFALWGVGDLTGGYNQKPILSVDKKEITSEEILNELNKLRYRMPQRPSLQEAINNGMLKNVLDKFEQEILINSEAVSLDLYVPLKVQTSTIRKEKAFKDPLGKFSQTRFVKSLNNAGLTESKYLEMINTEAYFKQLSMPFSFNKIYNNKIIKQLINWQNEVRDLDYVFLKIIDKKNIKKPPKNILKEYYNNNIEFYKIPKTRNIKYIEIKPSDFYNQIKINDEVIKEKYISEKEKFLTEEKRKFYQVITQDLEKANVFIKELKNGKDFIKAASNSFDLSINDIDIGYVKKSELPSSAMKKLFQGKINDLIGPIKTEFGYNTYKIISIQPKNNVPYKKVYAILKKEMLKELSLDILYKKIDVIEDLIAEGNNLKEIIRSKSIGSQILIQEIKQISKSGIIYSYNKDKSYLNINKTFLNEVWNTPINQISNVIELPGDKYLLIETVIENKEETPIFEKVNKNVYKEWLKEEIIFQTKLELKNLLKQDSINFQSLSSVKRNQKKLTKEINDPSLINNIFEIKNKNIMFFNLNNGVIAVRNVKSKIANYKINEEKIKDINLSLSKSFFNDYSQSYLELLANKHKLKRNYKDLEKFIGKLEN